MSIPSVLAGCSYGEQDLGPSRAAPRDQTSGPASFEDHGVPRARLASPAMRQGWLHAARRLLGAQPPETRQTLGFLEPVCTILEGGEKSLLDPLPPEQREFALKVLARCDADMNPPAPPPERYCRLTETWLEEEIEGRRAIEKVWRMRLACGLTGRPAR